ncbi:interleukin-17 receptor E-like protein [Rhinoraja longicauda]
MTPSKGVEVILASKLALMESQVMYSRIDPHPKLCMKFTTDEGSWVRCPFAHGYLPAWNMSVTGQLNKLQLTLLAQDKAEFKVALCNRTSANKCDPIEELYVSAGTAGAYSAVFNFPQEDCDSNICVQGWRTDVEYSARVQICGVFCKQNEPTQFLWPMAFTAIVLITVTLVIISGYLLFRALQRPYQKVFLYSNQLSRSIDIEVKGTSHF